MRLETTSSDALYYGFDKRFPDGTESSAASVPPPGKLEAASLITHHPDHRSDQSDFELHQDEYEDEDDDVFMDSYAVNNNHTTGLTDSPDGTNSAPDSDLSGHSTSAGDSMRQDVSMRSESGSSSPRRTGRLLRRRLFSKSMQQLWRETGSPGRNESEAGSDQIHGGEDAFVAKEKLVNMSHEKLRSYSTDFHSNSDGLRNRVLVESTLKKFFLQEIGSPPRSSLPSTPRKRSVSSSPLSSPTSPAFAYDDDSTSTLSDSIKRMKIIHSTPSSKRLDDDLIQVTDDDADVSIELDEYSMTDMSAVFRKIHCLTDLPIDAEF
jgi:hypothetical protein